MLPGDDEAVVGLLLGGVDDHDAAQLGQVLANLEDPVAQFLVLHDHNAGFRVAQHVPGLLGAQREVHGHRPVAGAQDPGVGDVPLGAVARPDRHVLVLLDALVEEEADPAVRRPAEVRPRDGGEAVAGAVEERGSRAQVGHLAEKEIDQRGAGGRGRGGRGFASRLCRHASGETATNSRCAEQLEEDLPSLC